MQQRKTFLIVKYRKFVTISLSSKSIVATIEITHALVPELTRSWSIYLMALILREAMHISEPLYCAPLTSSATDRLAQRKLLTNILLS